MKILVVGANGRTGRLVVQEAISRSHSVKSFIKGDSKKSVNKIVYGDARNYNDIITACSGIDVAISVVGRNRKSPPHLIDKTAENLIKASEKHHFKIVTLSGTGIRIDGDRPSPEDELLNFFVKLVDPLRIQDGVHHYRALKKSNINWTIVRVLKLTNGGMQNYSLTEHGPAKLFTSRESAAKALLDVAESDEWNKKLPVISPK